VVTGFFLIRWRISSLCGFASLAYHPHLVSSSRQRIPTSANRLVSLSTCRAFRASISLSIMKEAISKNSMVCFAAIEALNGIFRP